MRRTMLCFVACLVGLWSAQGLASEYYLGDLTEIGEKAAKLKAAGIVSTHQLAKAGATKADRAKLAKKTGLSSKEIISWVALCNILRIEGVGPEMARLMMAAGVKDLKILRKEDPAALLQRMAKANEKTALAGKLPSEQMLQQWIQRATALDLIVKPD